MIFAHIPSIKKKQTHLKEDLWGPKSVVLTTYFGILTKPIEIVLFLLKTAHNGIKSFTMHIAGPVHGPVIHEKQV